ncbi:MAG: poly(A) polymerase, partial [Massilia sp.]|nr:poly(A) polymerase [Massilia sp.]
EIDMELGEWWTAFYEGDAAEREQLLTSERMPAPGARKKRAPRRAKKPGEREGAVAESGGGGAE